MKIQKLIMLSEENIQNLRSVENQSKLIDELLSNYFKNLEPLTSEQKKKRLLQIEAQLEYKNKMEAIDNGTYSESANTRATEA